jgi:hypothetical protein
MSRLLNVSERSVAAVARERRSNHTYPVSDATIDRFIERAGPDRVLDALDRFTRPAQAAE